MSSEQAAVVLIPDRKWYMVAFEAWLVVANMLATVVKQINDL